MSENAIRDTFVSGWLRDIPVSKLSEAECVVELRRLRAQADERPVCEFADIPNERTRAALCREDCGCADALKRETEIAKRLMRKPTPE